MRTLVLSDLHANLTALEAALRAAEGRWDRAVCLGDVVGYGPDPNEVIERIRSLAEVTIRGNHDKAVCGLMDAGDFNPPARSAVEWSRAKLRPENLEFLQKLPPGPVEFHGAWLIHGSYRDEDEYVFTSPTALQSLVEAPAPITFFGHTHIQGGFVLRGDSVEAFHFRLKNGQQSAALKLESGAIYLLNPGSVGQPRDGDRRAGFMVADWENSVTEYWRVPYDVSAVQERMEAAGLPEPLILRLAAGR